MTKFPLIVVKLSIRSVLIFNSCHPSWTFHKLNITSVVVIFFVCHSVRFSSSLFKYYHIKNTVCPSLHRVILLSFGHTALASPRQFMFFSILLVVVDKAGKWQQKTECLFCQYPITVYLHHPLHYPKLTSSISHSNPSSTKWMLQENFVIISPHFATWHEFNTTDFHHCPSCLVPPPVFHFLPLRWGRQYSITKHFTTRSDEEEN